MSIGTRIKARREELGLTQPKLAELLGVSKGTIGNYETGISKPNEPILIRMFGVLKCDANYLYADDIAIDNIGGIRLTPEEQTYIKKYRQLDTYGQKAVDTLIDIELDRCTEQGDADRSNLIQICYISAPVSAGFGDMLEDFENREKMYVTYTEESRKADFMLKVDGDSMRPKFNDGDYILIRKQPAVEVGQIGIFAHNGNGYVKKFGGDRLISLNPKYDDIMVNGDTICFGLVLGIADVVS